MIMMNKIIFILALLLISFFSVHAQQKDEIQKLLPEGGTAWDHFGWSVDISEDYAIVGAPHDGYDGVNPAGSAYILYNNSGTWEQQDKVTPIINSNDEFGSSVSISGDHAIVGASYHHEDPSGAAYIYHRESNEWKEQIRLVTGDGSNYDNFGCSVSISGDHAIVGADYYNLNSGAAYIYHNKSGIWEEQAKLTASSVNLSVDFGRSVDISGDYAVVGVPSDYENGRKTGSAYVFYNNSGSWVQKARLIASDGNTDDLFGNSVSIAGNNIIVGIDPFYNDTLGAAYVFEKPDEGWRDTTETVKLTPNDDTTNCFGRSVSISHDRAVVGATCDDYNGKNSGAAYLFLRNSGAWDVQAKLIASDGAPNDLLGNSVSVSGDYIIVGSRDNNTSIGEDSGLIYIFSSVSTQISELAEQFDISLFPNPTIGLLNYEAPANHIKQIKIIDLMGKVQIEKTNLQDRGNINLSQLNNGVYIVILKTQQGDYSTKIVKE